MSAQTHHRPTNWLGLFLALALLATLLQAGSPGFSLVSWDLAQHFPKSAQQAKEKGEKKDRAKDAGKTGREQAVPRNVDVPNLYLGLYTEYMGSDWEIIAGVYKIESNHGQSSAPGVKSGVNTFGCCAGPGQFHIKNGHSGGIKGSTWDTWGTGRRKDVYNPRHAVPATTKMLRAWYNEPVTRECSGTGLDARWVNALRHYNNSCGYVRDIAAWVRTYSKAAAKGKVGEIPKGMTFTTSHGCNPKRDWRRGAWTPEVRGFLVKLASKFSFRISCGAEGHSRFVKGTNRESAHWTGRAFDVDVVNGQPVSPSSDTAFGHQALGFGARQVGGPHVLCSGRTPSGGKRCFTDGGHKGHWHIQP